MGYLGWSEGEVIDAPGAPVDAATAAADRGSPERAELTHSEP